MPPLSCHSFLQTGQMMILISPPLITHYIKGGFGNISKMNSAPLGSDPTRHDLTRV